MKVNYSVAFKINGNWTEDIVFRRDVYSDNPLDEELDTSQIDNVPDYITVDTSTGDLALIPPFTPVRITVTDENGQSKKRYFLTEDRDTEAVTLFTD